MVTKKPAAKAAAPKSKATSGDVTKERRRAPPEARPATELEIPQILDIHRVATQRAIRDISVWREERYSTETRLVQWPLPEQASGYEQLLALLFESAVETTIALLVATDDPALPTLPPSMHDPKFQVLLRVVQRAHIAARAEIEAKFDGVRATGWREAKVRTNALGFSLAATALRDMPRPQALDLLGLKKSGAYRAAGRKR